MPQPRRRSRAKQYFAAAFREAGHAVAAYDQGVMLMNVSIFRTGPGVGKNVWNDALRNVDFDWIKTADSPALSERLAVILMAGPVAQRYFLPASPKGDEHRKRLEQTRRLLDAAAGGRERGKKRFERMHRDLERFFRRGEINEAVTELAKTLLLKGTVLGEDAVAIVAANAKDGTRSRRQRRAP
jgi:hypothetical protein